MSISISVPTPENLKEKAKLARQFLKDKCGADIPHGRCIEMISQVFGFKDWNTATAELSSYERMKALASIRSTTPEAPKSIKGMTVGEFRTALAPYPDSATIDFNYQYNLGEFINSIDDFENPEDTVDQEFAATAVRKVDDNYVNLMLTLKNEELSSTY